MPNRTWTDDDLIREVPLANSFLDLYHRLNVSGALYTTRAIKARIEVLGLPITHFTRILSKEKRKEEGIKRKRICNCCKEHKPFDEFPIRSLEKMKLSFTCYSCQKKTSRKHYEEHKKEYLDRALVYNKKAIETNKVKMCEYLSMHPCVDCGEKDIRVLEFHHLRDKEVAIGRMINAGGTCWETIKKEIEKCQVLCANCHRKKTLDEADSYRTTFNRNMGV